MDELIFAATLLAALGAALLAGNFFAFSAYLMRALEGLSAERGIVAMQAITLAIKRPGFLVVFFGTAALCAVLAIFAALHWGTPGACVLLVGTLLFLIGTFAVTMLRNTPLNTQLAAATPDTEDGHDVWKRFQTSWSRWNHVRMIAALLACAALILAIADMGNPFAR